MTVLSCAEAVKQFFAYLDRALGGESLEDLERHLDACLACCDKLAFSRELDTFVRRRLSEGALPDGLEPRVREALARAASE